jgi:DNA-binding winged helix-turn-helix (wHTH) protein
MPPLALALSSLAVAALAAGASKLFIVTIRGRGFRLDL